MAISIFQVIGPVMIGPSSSHTAGAAKLARIARLIAGRPFTHVSFGLHGSFARTYKGHGTDRALVAGAMGLFEYDEQLADSFILAKKAGITYDFHEADLEDAHENSVRITFTMKDGSTTEIIGSSTGGGRILITSIDGFSMEFTAESSALIIRQKDKPGIISDVSGVLADNAINIAGMKVSRTEKDDLAFCIIETDDAISDEIVRQIWNIEHVLSVQAINITGQEG
jgi:L-serine dehydratase